MRISRLVFVTMLIVALVTGVTACGSNDVAARVNGEEISRAELDEQVERMREQSPQMFEDDADGSRLVDFQRRLLDSLIDYVLVRQEAEARGITVSAEDIDVVVDEYRVGFQDEAEFTAALQNVNMTMEDLREQVEEQLVMQLLMEELVDDSEVEAAAVEEYYESNTAMFTQPAGIRPAHILFEPEDRETAEAVLAEVRAGGDFAELAREHSIDPGSKEQGGDLDWNSPPYPFVEEFNAALDGLEVGEVSDLVESQFGWHIVTVTESREESVEPLSEVAEQIETMIVQQRNADAYQVFLDDLRERAEIEILIDELKQEDEE